MSSSEYSYDSEGQFFPFFMLTIVGLVTIPLTYNVLKPSTELEETATRIETDFKPQDENIIQDQKRRRKRKERKIKRIVATALGWLAMAYLTYLVSNAEATRIKLWDPYDILGVSRSASEKDIDRFYKRLSIKYHPDKAKPDTAKNETLETINDRWVEMTKAYKALTDEEIRNNYLMYGNPDGKQGTSIGIALPKWMVEEGNRWFVVAFYGILLGIVLPLSLARWWYGTQSKTKEHILHSSAGNLFREWQEDIDENGIVAALSVGEEYQETVKPDTGAARVESRVLGSPLIPESAKAKLKAIDDPMRRKTLSLLWAYLGRVEIGDINLETEKYSVAPTAFLLNNSFSSMTLPFQLLSPLIASYRVQQCLIQGIAPSLSPALQLPHFTQEMVNKISGSNSSKNPLTIQKLMRLPSHLRRKLCSDLSDEQYTQAMKVVAQMPYLDVAKTFFKVQGDRVVTPGSLVQLIVKARLIPPGTKAEDIPAIKPADLEDADPDEEDLDALHGRKPPKPEQPPLAHAPYYAADHAPRWHIFLADTRSGRIAVPPFTFTAFDKAPFNADGTPTFNVLTFRCQFQAPPQLASFPFTMHMICDSYVGLDTKVDVVLEVRPFSAAETVESDDEISEPDEDSIAGQLQAMKTGAPPKKKSKKPTEKVAAKSADSDEDESDTDGSAADDTSETDTETEDES